MGHRIYNVLQVAVIIFFNYVLSAEYPPTFTVVTPNKLRPKVDFRVIATVHHEVEKPVDILGSIVGNLTDGTTFSRTWSFKFDSPQTLTTTIKVPDLHEGTYKLLTQVTGGIQYEKETLLPVETKTFSAFIQTDKAVYKPGQKILFRILTIDPSLKPVQKPYEVSIIDPNRNRIKHWKDVENSGGVFENEIELSTQPNMGSWSILVNASNELFNKNFDVQEYVLPTFNVDIKLPPYATVNSSKIVATITAMYTFGKKVKGTLYLTVNPDRNYYHFNGIPVKSFHETKEIDGSVDIEVDLKKDTESLSYIKDFIFDAKVVEYETGRNYSATKKITMHDNDVDIDFVPVNTFKPGLRFRGVVKVSYRDDTPVEDDGPAVNISYELSSDFNNKHFNIIEVPKGGLINLDIVVPNYRGVNSLTFRAEYKNVTHYLNWVRAALSPSNSFLQANIDEEKQWTVGDQITVFVNTTEEMNHLIYEVVGKGKVLLLESFKLTGEVHHNFKFLLTHEMTPNVKILIYYVRSENQEIVGDSVSVDIKGLFRTPVDVKSSLNVTKPGSAIDIIVNTLPKTSTYLLGVDQSVLLLKTGNDISENEVIKEIKSYDNHKNEYFGSSWRSVWHSPRIAAQIFSSSGLLIVSNGLVAESSYSKSLASSYSSDPCITTPPSSALSVVKQQSGQFVGGQMLTEASSQKIVTRKEFPETWLWTSKITGTDGKAVYSTTVPDTITSWFVNSFAINQVYGLGIASEKAKITVFRPFFLKLSLPYSVKRGETLTIPVLVFNYFSKLITAQITFEKNDEFDFIDETNGQLVNVNLVKKVEVQSNDVASVTVLIKPKKVGFISLKVTGTTEAAGDAILKKLKVIPEGVTQYFNKAVLTDLKSGKSTNQEVQIDIPSAAVPDSEYITVTAIGDILGPTLNNVDDLLRLPYGCGEQNMVNFVPNIVVLDYLTKAGRLTDVLKNKAIKNMESGYQRQLSYKHGDGSYSSFGKRDSSGSTFLTAYVLKSFQQAKKYIQIEDEILDSAAKYLISTQLEDGSFNNTGKLFSSQLSGGSDRNKAALTSYVLISLLQDEDQKKKYDEPIKLAEKYLAGQLANLTDPYVISIIAYAFHLSNNQEKDSAANKLSDLAKKTPEFTWWEELKPVNKTECKSYYTCTPPPSDIEMTSYALLTLVLRNEVSTAVSVLKWLISKQNSNGGFSSTQDTVIGIQALGSLASYLSSDSLDILLNIQYLNNRSKQIKIDSGNSLVLQKHELPSETRNVKVQASGKGTAVVQVSWNYNLVLNESDKEAFKLNSEVKRFGPLLKIKVCSKYLAGDVSNMAVLEIHVPSGYEIEENSVAYNSSVPVERVDYENGNSNVLIYLQRVTGDEVCVTLEARKIFDVQSIKPATLTIYDYYNRMLIAHNSYEVPLKDFVEVTTKKQAVLAD